MAMITHQVDPAAVFACALSLRDACLAAAKGEPELDLSEAYNGFDEFIRQVMRVADLFERWACEHVVFEELDEPWTCAMEGFGIACLKVTRPDALGAFDEADGAAVAMKLPLPLRMSRELPLPIDLRVPTGRPAPAFRELAIRALKARAMDGEIEPYTADDHPFHDSLGPVFFGLFGVGEDDALEEIACRTTYHECRELAQRLMPGAEFPHEVVWRDTGRHSPGSP